MQVSLGLCVSILVIIVGTVCWGRGVNGDAYIADLLHPHRSGWSDQKFSRTPYAAPSRTRSADPQFWGCGPGSSCPCGEDPGAERPFWRDC